MSARGHIAAVSIIAAGCLFCSFLGWRMADELLEQCPSPVFEDVKKAPPALADNPVPDVKEVLYTWGGTFDNGKTGFLVEGPDPGMFALVDPSVNATEEIGTVWMNPATGKIVVEIANVRVGIDLVGIR